MPLFLDQRVWACCQIMSFPTAQNNSKLVMHTVIAGLSQLCCGGDFSPKPVTKQQILGLQ